MLTARCVCEREEGGGGGERERRGGRQRVRPGRLNQENERGTGMDDSLLQ